MPQITVTCHLLFPRHNISEIQNKLGCKSNWQEAVLEKTFVTLPSDKKNLMKKIILVEGDTNTTYNERNINLYFTHAIKNIKISKFNGTNPLEENIHSFKNST